jgi:hypothetical protein
VIWKEESEKRLSTKTAGKTNKLIVCAPRQFRTRYPMVKSPNNFKTKRHETMATRMCAICHEYPVSTKFGSVWIICNKCNTAYYFPHKDEYSIAEFIRNIKYFEAQHEGEKDKILKELLDE